MAEADRSEGVSLAFTQMDGADGHNGAAIGHNGIPRDEQGLATRLQDFDHPSASTANEIVPWRIIRQENLSSGGKRTVWSCRPGNLAITDGTNGHAESDGSD